MARILPSIPAAGPALVILGAVLGLFPGPGARASEAADGESGAAVPRRVPFVVVLGIAQDGGIPQAGSFDHPGWEDPTARRRVVSLGLLDPVSGGRWMFEATPDFRRQLHDLQAVAPRVGEPLDGVFLTHAHIGHYTGLIFLGHESMGARGVPVWAMPRMRRFLSENGPWDQLVRYGNIELRELRAGRTVELTPALRVTPFSVPHRQEYSEVVGFRIQGPDRSVAFLPDIDSWGEWEEAGGSPEALVRSVDVAYLDATFFADGEIPGRDMSGFPHPLVTETIERLSSLPVGERAKVRLIHLNHTNPIQRSDSRARRVVREAGLRVAEEGEIVPLGNPTPERRTEAEVPQPD